MKIFKTITLTNTKLMKNNNPIILLISILIIALLASCNSNQKKEDEFDTIMQEVINVHDEVMPKMGNLGTLIKKLDSHIDTTATSKPYIKAQEDLKKSYDSMMEWMQDFSKKFPYNEKVTAEDPTNFESKMKLLITEKEEVYALKEQINTSIENANTLLNQ